MEIFRVGDDFFEVHYEGKVKILSLEEVLAMLSQPSTNNVWNDLKGVTNEVRDNWGRTR